MPPPVDIVQQLDHARDWLQVPPEASEQRGVVAVLEVGGSALPISASTMRRVASIVRPRKRRTPSSNVNTWPYSATRSITTSIASGSLSTSTPSLSRINRSVR